MNALAAESTWPVLATAFVLGLLVGSFLNVVIHRVPRGESVVRPRSRCPACGHEIGALENVPVLSYLFLRGRCRACAAPIHWRYPAVELLTALVFAGVVARHGAGLEGAVLLVFASLLLAAAGIDFDHRIIPDEISLGGLAAGLVLAPAAAVASGGALVPALVHSGAGAALGFGLLWSVGFLHARLAVATGRTFPHWPGEGEAYPRPGSLDWWTWFPGMGFGDVKLMAMIGAFLGPVGVVETLLLGALAGVALGLAFWLATRDFAQPFGFGPALAAGALAVVLSPWRLSLPF